MVSKYFVIFGLLFLGYCCCANTYPPESKPLTLHVRTDLVGKQPFKEGKRTFGFLENKDTGKLGLDSRAHDIKDFVTSLRFRIANDARSHLIRMSGAFYTHGGPILSPYFYTETEPLDTNLEWIPYDELWLWGFSEAYEMGLTAKAKERLDGDTAEFLSKLLRKGKLWDGLGGLSELPVYEIFSRWGYLADQLPALPLVKQLPNCKDTLLLNSRYFCYTHALLYMPEISDYMDGHQDVQAAMEKSINSSNYELLDYFISSFHNYDLFEPFFILMSNLDWLPLIVFHGLFKNSTEEFRQYLGSIEDLPPYLLTCVIHEQGRYRPAVKKIEKYLRLSLYVHDIYCLIESCT